MSVEDNLLIGAFVHRRHHSIETRLNEVFALYPRLRERRAQRGGSMSGGEQQMVAIGRALMLRPRLLMLDEPSHGLAPMIVEELHRTLAEIHARGTAILLVEQNSALALSLANRGIVLEGGHVVLREARICSAGIRVCARHISESEVAALPLPSSRATTPAQG